MRGAGASGSPPSGTTCTGRCSRSGRARGRSSDSGIRGIERQEGIVQDGIINDALYQKLRRILVPEGPHKGEPIFDSISVRLLNQALAEYGPGSEERRVREAITDFCLRS